MLCILSNGSDVLPNLKIKYVTQDCLEKLSTIGRMFNDFGSLSRDRVEKNLNSVGFPEFNGEGKSDEELLIDLLSLAKYEGKGLTSSFMELERACGNRFSGAYDSVRLFYYVTQIYNEIYEVRDLSKQLP